MSVALGGVACEAVPWDNQVVDWDRFDLVVIRSTWDWSSRVEEFLAWVHSLGRVVNGADVVEWNHDKRYLAALQVVGVPVVPTRWDPDDLPGGDRWIAKPTVSAGARDTVAGDRATVLAHVDAIHRAGKRAIVQPYVESIDDRGETAIVYLDGQLSHAVRKDARLGLDKRQERVERRTPTPDEVDVADAALDALPFDRDELLYARVDLVADDRTGDPLLLELELVEPSLFLGHGDGAAERFAAAILRRF